MFCKCGGQTPVKTGYAGFGRFWRFPVMFGVNLTEFCAEKYYAQFVRYQSALQGNLGRI
jgi:hypothetical protein